MGWDTARVDTDGIPSAVDGDDANRAEAARRAGGHAIRAAMLRRADDLQALGTPMGLEVAERLRGRAR